MRKMLIFLFGFSIVFLFACQKEKYSSEEKKFMKLYKEILIARYTIEDSAKANEKVMEILKRNGFSFREFLDFSWELRSKDVKKFQEMLDSIKNEAAKEVLETKKKEIQVR
ncbi:MAG: hypothetical protein N2560_06655 [Ignavibacteria bacterium]|nr:hypothetical protein [Ignavibacteria bacterium]